MKNFKCVFDTKEEKTAIKFISRVFNNEKKKLITHELIFNDQRVAGVLRKEYNKKKLMDMCGSEELFDSFCEEKFSRLHIEDVKTFVNDMIEKGYKWC